MPKGRRGNYKVATDYNVQGLGCEILVCIFSEVYPNTKVDSGFVIQTTSISSVRRYDLGRVKLPYTRNPTFDAHVPVEIYQPLPE